MNKLKTIPPIQLLLAISVICVGIYSLIQLVNHLQKPNEIPQELRGILLPNPITVTEFNLRDHHGKPFSNNQLKGRWTILFFGYTHCPDVCPTALAMLENMLTRLNSNPQAAQDLKVVFISIDPNRDTLEILRDYVPYFHKDFLGVTGTSEQIQTLSKQLKVSYHLTSEIDNEGNYDVSHTSAFFLIDPQSRFTALFQSQFHDPAKMAAAFSSIKTLKAKDD